MVQHFNLLQIVVVLANLLLAEGQQYASSVPTSPCPAVFSYDGTSSVQGQWYGGLKISTDVSLYGIWIDVILDRRGESLSSSFGEVSSSDNLSYKIENKQQNINPGTHLQITISVTYNSLYSTPRVQTLRLNGQQICPSSIHSIQPVLPVQSNSGRVNINRGNSNRDKDNRDYGRDSSHERENTNTAIVYPSNSGSRDSVYTQNSGRDHITESPSGRRESSGFGYGNQDSSRRENTRTTESPDRGYDNQNSPGRGYDNQNSPGRGYDNQNSPGRGYDNQNSPSGVYDNQNSPGRGNDNQNSPGRGNDNQNSPGRGNDNQNSPGRGNDNQNSPGRGNVRTNENPSRGYDIQDTYGRTNSDEVEKSYALSLVPSVSHSYTQTNDQGGTLTSRLPAPEYSVQERRVTPSQQYPSSRPSGNGNSGQSSTKYIPLSPSSGRTSTSRRPQMTSTSTQTRNAQPDANHDYESDDDDNVDTSRKSARGGGSSSSNDYFQGDHRIPPEAKIHPTPPQSRPPSRQSSADSQQPCGKVAVQAAPLIVNGELAKQGQWPWHVALYRSETVDSKYICGGSLVSLRHVLTAAHCATRTNTARIVNAQTLTVHLGKFNLRKTSDGVQIMFVRKIFIHPDYNASTFYADLAVLKFTKDAEYSNVVRPVCLWQDSETDLTKVVGREGSVVGWGYDENNRLQEELAMTRMPIVEQLTCLWSFKEFFSHFTSNRSFCAGFANGTSVCNGDSGGGMVFSEAGYPGNTNTWHLRGVVSISVARQSEAVCDPNHYVVFTDAAQFLTWIKQTIER